MSRKRLTIYDFGEKIMNDLDTFLYTPISVKRKYLAENITEQQSKVYSLTFQWSWNDYSGYGQIDFDIETKQVCNVFRENSSNIYIDSKSKRQAIKHVSELYNDKNLEYLFNHILSMTNINCLL